MPDNSVDFWLVRLLLYCIHRVQYVRGLNLPAEAERGRIVVDFSCSGGPQHQVMYNSLLLYLLLAPVTLSSLLAAYVECGRICIRIIFDVSCPHILQCLFSMGPFSSHA